MANWEKQMKKLDKLEKAAKKDPSKRDKYYVYGKKVLGITDEDLQRENLKRLESQDWSP